MSAPILVGGEALYDLVAHADGALEGHPGGGPFNTARTIGGSDHNSAQSNAMR